jgi:hypothetical protein
MSLYYMRFYNLLQIPRVLESALTLGLFIPSP